MQNGIREPDESGPRQDVLLEIQTSIDHESSIAASGRDAAKAGGIDAQVRGRWRSEIRMVQYVDGIYPKFEFLCLGYPHSFDQVGIETNDRRTFNPGEAKRTDLTWSRIDQQQPSLGIRNRFVAE